jgi:hypothetical protein
MLSFIYHPQTIETKFHSIVLNPYFSIFLTSNSGDNNLNLITRVLLEEIGHKVDSVINTTDTTGDEGELFAHLILQKNLTRDQIQAIQVEDDTAIIRPGLINSSYSNL